MTVLQPDVGNQRPSPTGDKARLPSSYAQAERSGAICLAIPGQLIEVVDEPNRLARVDVAGVHRTVNIGLLDADGTSPGPGEWVLIHVGFAISKVDEEEAHATRELLEQMGAEYEQELEELKGSVIE